MFDIKLRSADDSAVVAAIEQWAAAEASASARRIAAVAELVRRRCGDDDRADWACDSWDAAAAEVSAALSISHGRASGEMRLGLALALRLPRVAEMFRVDDDLVRDMAEILTSFCARLYGKRAAANRAARMMAAAESL